jgi:hypothetical protein
MKRALIIILLAIVANASLVAQTETNNKGFRVDYFTGFKAEGSLGYNFLISDDKETQDLFQTTIMGFGSGFILDIISGRASVDVFDIGWEKVNITLGVGYAISKYRFAQNLVFGPDTVNGVTGTNVWIDENPDHDYVNTFFGYGKSKIAYGTINFPLHANVKLGSFKLSAGPIIDLYVSGKHKRKYLENDKKIKDKVGNEDFRNYDINKTKTGINMYVTHKSGISFGATYMLTPFFNSPLMNDVQEVRFSFGYSPPSFKGAGGKSPKDIIKSI